MNAAKTFEKLNRLLTHRRQVTKLDYLLITLVTGFAFLVRLLRSKAGLPYMHYWDEPDIAFRAFDMVVSGDFNPHFFNYGSLLIYLNYLVDLAASLFQGSVNNLVYGIAAGFDWYISNSEFLLWDRGLTAIFGALTVGLVYILTLKIGSRLAAVISAASLAILDFHILHSSRVTTDVPVAFFIFLAALLAYLYLENGNEYHILASLFVTGLAASTKYNGGLIVIVPLAVVLIGRKPKKPFQRWRLALLLPALGFFIASPFILFDFRTFLADFTYEITHYADIGHGGHAVEPGLPNILLQQKNFLNNLGWVGVSLLVLGLVIWFRTDRAWLLLIFPIVYFLALTRLVVDFQRNYVAIYPFIAVAIGLGGGMIFRGLLRIGRWLKWDYYWAIGHLAVLVAVGWLGYQSFITLKIARAAWLVPETRSQSIDQVNQLAAPLKMVGIAKELRMHEEDLARLNASYRVLPYLDLLSTAEDYDLIIGFRRLVGSTDTLRAEAAIINQLISQLPAEGKINIGWRDLNIHLFSIDPQVVILTQPDTIPSDLDFSSP